MREWQKRTVHGKRRKVKNAKQNEKSINGYENKDGRLSLSLSCCQPSHNPLPLTREAITISQVEIKIPCGTWVCVCVFICECVYSMRYSRLSKWFQAVYSLSSQNGSLWSKKEEKNLNLPSTPFPLPSFIFFPLKKSNSLNINCQAESWRSAYLFVMRLQKKSTHNPPLFGSSACVNLFLPFSAALSPPSSSSMEHIRL